MSKLQTITKTENQSRMSVDKHLERAYNLPSGLYYPEFYYCQREVSRSPQRSGSSFSQVCGWLSDIALVIDGQVYYPAARRLHCGGQDITDSLKRLLLQQQRDTSYREAPFGALGRL